MLNSISWQQYLTATIVLSILWYTYVGLRYYRPELRSILRIKASSSSIVPPVAGNLSAVMGSIQAEVDTGVYAPETLIFGASVPDDISDQTLPKGPADDLIDEAKVLVDAYRENDNKTEFLSLFKLLLDKYEVFADEISLPAVIRSISEFSSTRLPFPLKDTEWPLTF